MALTVLRSKRDWRRYTVYDLEWIPGSVEEMSRGGAILSERVRMVGVYDERGYRWYHSVDSFLFNEMTSENRGRWFYAHAGGLADIQFVFNRMVERRGYQVDARFSGSSAVICKIKRGKNNWTFIDSLWLLRESLEEIGHWVGIEKGAKEQRLTDEQAREFYATCSMEELILYNERDCVILYEAISAMQDALYDFGGQLQMTLASSAMNLFRRKYLQHDIETHPFVNDTIRESYYASRVEVISQTADEAFYYDINSSFPHAMTMACPGEFLGASRDLPDYGLYFADVTIQVPDSYLPPTPTRIAGRLFFPIGRWRSWLSGVDIELLEREGGRIIKVHESYQFAPFNDLKNYAETIYEQRKREPDGFKKIALKLLMNTLYGKFAESSWKTSLMIDPMPDQVDYENDEMFLPGIWLKERKVPIPHMHVPISAYITSIARRSLFDRMAICRDVHYCDTDGFSTTERLNLSSELGGLKLEKMPYRECGIDRDTESTYLASKLYRQQGMILKDGIWIDIETTKYQGVRAKGFSRPTIKRFEALQRGEEIEAVRMRRVRELMRKGDTRPREDVILKSINIKDAVPKRFIYPDGGTRPWHIDELRNLNPTV
jgi:DNA polymerase type B, organellar and viral